MNEGDSLYVGNLSQRWLFLPYFHISFLPLPSLFYQPPITNHFLPFSISVKEKDLEDLVSPYGKAVHCTITRDKDGNSKNYGFLRMETSEQADRCVSVLNKSPFFGKNINVEKVIIHIV